MKCSIKILRIILIIFPLVATGQGYEETQCTVNANGEEVCASSSVVETQPETIVRNDGDEDENCKDTDELCSFWASHDECTKNPNFMLKGCPKSCNSCPEDTILKGSNYEVDLLEKESLLSAIAKYGEQQEVDGDKQHETMFVIKKTIDYMKNFIYAEHPTHQLSEDVIKVCRNDYTLCSFWAAFGECENNAGFMVTKCAPVCLSCHKINYNERYV